MPPENLRWHCLIIEEDHQPSLWQEPACGQPEQPQEQDLPAFLLFLILKMMNVTIKSNIRLIIIVDKLVFKKSIIEITVLLKLIENLKPSLLFL